MIHGKFETQLLHRTNSRKLLLGLMISEWKKNMSQWNINRDRWNFHDPHPLSLLCTPWSSSCTRTKMTEVVWSFREVSSLVHSDRSQQCSSLFLDNSIQSLETRTFVYSDQCIQDMAPTFKLHTITSSNPRPLVSIFFFFFFFFILSPFVSKNTRERLDASSSRCPSIYYET